MQAQASVEDFRFDAERRRICRGSVLVRFEHLKWNEYTKQNEAKRKTDPKHVERIKQIFIKRGCRPRDVGNHIPALVDQQRLEVALEDARRNGKWKMNTLPSNSATIDAPDGYPELNFPSGIECLRGRHRIRAGEEWLPASEKWWIVDLYLSTISDELKTLLVEEHPSEEKPRDGEICRKILEYKSLPSRVESKFSPATCISFEAL